MQQEGASIWLEQAIQIQRSLGVQRGKSDPVDARRIALYAYKNRQEVRLWVPRREKVEELKELLNLRESSLNTLSRLRKPIKELKSHGNPRIAKLIEDSSQGSIEGARKDLASIEAKIDELFSKYAQLSRLMEAMLEQQELTQFFKEIQEILFSFPYHLFIKAQERTYQGLVLSMLRGMRINVAAEIPSSLGCLDLLIQVPTTTYVIELKLDSSPEAGLKQIRKQQYHAPYLGKGKAIAIVGLSFSSDTRSIATWQGELLDEDGKLIRKLAPAAKQ